MEQAKDYENKIKTLKQTLTTLQQALDIDISGFEGIALDTIRSGQVQKFEVGFELFWKTTKKFLYEIHGIESVSPKMVMKQLYRSKYVDEKKYEKLIEMVNDRNRLSHVYNETQFNEIYKRITEYHGLIINIGNEIDLSAKNLKQVNDI